MDYFEEIGSFGAQLITDKYGYKVFFLRKHNYTKIYWLKGGYQRTIYFDLYDYDDPNYSSVTYVDDKQKISITFENHKDVFKKLKILMSVI